MLELVRIPHDVDFGDSVAVELEVAGLDRAVADIDHIAQRAVDNARLDPVAFRLLVPDADEEAGDLFRTEDRVERRRRLAAAVGVERGVRAEQCGQSRDVAAGDRALEAFHHLLLLGA